MSEWTSVGRGCDGAFPTISLSQAAMLNLNCGSLSPNSMAPVSTSAPHVSTATLVMYEVPADRAKGGSLPSAASSSASQSPWTAASGILPTTTATSAFLGSESPKLPPMTTTPGDNLSLSLPSTVFFTPEMLAEWEPDATTTTLSQGNASSAPQCLTALEGHFAIITTNSELLLPGRSDQPQDPCPSGTTVAVSVPQRQAERPQDAELGVDSDMSRDDSMDDQSQDDVPSRAPRKRATRASPYMPTDLTDKEAIKKLRNREAARRCRDKKEERIAELKKESDKISEDLKRKVAHRDRLREEVAKLMRAVQIHQRAGCTFVNLPPGYLQ